VPMEELMDTLIHEVELLAKEKEAEAGGEAPASHSNQGWEALPGADQRSTRGKEIPILSNKS
jgi:(E)-4-hydroxy-3-methylbut-2-enyl-diphosphate synthase